MDHLTVIAPTLVEGVSHVKNCLDIKVPFGTRHHYMGTHNHRLQLGGSVYLEIVALDPEANPPNRSRWFGLDNQQKVRMDWDNGRRLRGWVVSTVDIASDIAIHGDIFGEQVSLPPEKAEFDFSIPIDGSLPLDGIVPSLIDHKNDPTSIESIPDLGARLESFSMEHSVPAKIQAIYRNFSIDYPPKIVFGPRFRWKARIETPNGMKLLT